MDPNTSTPQRQPAQTPSVVNPSCGRPVAHFLNVLVVIGSLVLLTTMSLEAFVDVGRVYYATYLHIQLWVCVVFLIDFFYRLSLSDNGWKFFWRNLVYLLVSIPYLNIVAWSHLSLDTGWEYLLRVIPLVRGGYGLAIVVGRIVHNRATSLFVAYLLVVLALVYFSSIVFFILERPVNAAVNSYGTSLWWAFLNVTTVGAPIFAKTAVGKILTVVLAGSGMMLFPIFTVYVTTLIQQRKLNQPSN